MQLSSSTITDGVSERHFTLGDIPGVLWTPVAAVRSPLVLLAHGGGQHKQALAWSPGPGTT